MGHPGSPRMSTAPPSTSDLHYDLAQLQANDVNVRIDRGSVKMAEAPAPWSYLAYIRPDRVSAGERDTTPAALEVTLEVTSGTIGVMLLEDGTSEGAIDETLVRPENGLTTVRLFVPDPSSAGQFIVRNAGHADGPIALHLHKIDLKPVSLRAAVDDANALHAFYDLTIYPSTFDFAYFLMAAEIARHKAGFKSLRVYIVRPGRDALIRLPSGYNRTVDEHAREWRISNVLLPILSLFPSVGGYSVLPDRVAASALREHLTNVYPGPLSKEAVPIHLSHQEVNSELARTPGAIRPCASTEGLRFIHQWITARARGRKVVTITLRQYGYLLERNSNVEAWAGFAKELVGRNYFPVIVPDTATALAAAPPEFAGITIFPEAALSLPLRMALYESAYLNFATSGGPPSLMILSDRCPFLMLKLLIPNVPLSSADHLTETGFTIGEDPPYLSVRQHIVWESDDLPIIRREFDAIVVKIERDTALKPQSDIQD